MKDKEMEIIKEGLKDMKDKMRKHNLHPIWDPEENKCEKKRNFILKGNGSDISRKSCTHRSGEHYAFQREETKRNACLDT